MKKILLLLSVILLCTSCGDVFQFQKGPFGWVWCIENHTKQILIFKCPYSSSLFQSNSEHREFRIKPFDSYIICNGETQNVISFDYYIKRSADIFGEDVNWQLLSEDGVVLKTWSYSDWGQANQRFFEESSWAYHKSSDWLSAKNYWTFTILPEDIVSE